MNPILLAAGCAAAVALAAVTLSLFAIFQTRSGASASRNAAARVRADLEAQISALRTALEACSAEVRRMEQQSAAQPGGQAKPAFNVGKRSQALRMHRRGDSPEAIATALELPRGEVELLLKVHRIVIDSIAS